MSVETKEYGRKRGLTVVLAGLLELPGDERKSLTAALRDDLEALAVSDLEDLLREEIGRRGQSGHNRFVARLSQTEELRAVLSVLFETGEG